MNDVWVVIPAYNESQRLPATLGQFRGRFPNVVVVDDGSVDETDEAALRFPGTWVLRHPCNLGQGAAIQTGIDFALSRGAGYIVTFDADGQHDVDDITALLRPLREGQSDVALGSRFLGAAPGMPWRRRLLIKLALLFTWAFSRIRLSDTHNGLRAFSRPAAERIRITLNGMAHASEILDQIRKFDIPFVEVPVTVHYTPATLEKGQNAWNSLRIVASLTMTRILR